MIFLLLIFISRMGMANTGVGTQILMEPKQLEHFLAEVNYFPKNYKADEKIYTDIFPSQAKKMFQRGPLSQGHCFRQCVNEGKTHDKCLNHFIDVSVKTVNKKQIKHYHQRNLFAVCTK